MFRNLILAIFLVALALPAVAMPIPVAAPGAPAMEDCHGMPMDHDKGDAGDHSQHRGCIGCIAPQAAMPVAFGPPTLPFIIALASAKKLSGTIPRPSLPPPRA